MSTDPIHPAVRVGHVHLCVSDLDRAIAFYRDVLGFTVTADARSVGHEAAFLAAGDYHHHIGLNTLGEPGGLYHAAFLYPDERELARAVERVLDHGHPISHATDHGATVAVYLSDPDGNGLELYYDRPRSEWFDAHGEPILRNRHFDPRELLT
jgi:catechol 2,3-dioxygenase